MFPARLQRQHGLTWVGGQASNVLIPRFHGQAFYSSRKALRFVRGSRIYSGVARRVFSTTPMACLVSSVQVILYRVRFDYDHHA